MNVVDTGVGLLKKDLPNLFNKFGMIKHRAAADDGSGIGLGLTIVKKIVEHSGGSVTASSPGLGRGSTFSFCMNMKASAVDESQTNNSMA